MDLTIEEKDALLRYAREHGKQWKYKLRQAWLNGQPGGTLLRLRNKIGPSGLDKVKLTK